MNSRKWNFKSFDELQNSVNATLRYAMLNERSKRWTKVIENYKNMLWMISKKNMPEDYEPPSEINMLLYETYYHLGLAYQQGGDHKKAIVYFTKAIDVISIPKGGCLAGCVVNSCLMTPLFARRAFAKANIGDKDGCLKDAERTVVLDSKNPDVFAIRALAHSTRDDIKLALTDLDTALLLNPNHMCSLVLRAALTKPLYDPMDGRVLPNKYLLKIQRLDPQAESYMDVHNFTHSCTLEFYDKFLYTLSVPHTIINVDLRPDKPSKKQIEQNYTSRPSTAASRPKSAPAHMDVYSEPFKCGVLTPSEFNKSTTRRRYDYSEAVRKHMARPRTASQYFAQLEKERKKKSQMEEILFRKSLMADFHASVTPSRGLVTPMPSRIVQQNKNSSPVPNSILKKTTTSATKTTFVIETPTNYSISAFQPMNIKDAPRMYYKPWNGDKLPAAPVKRRTPAPAFY